MLLSVAGQLAAKHKSMKKSNGAARNSRLPPHVLVAPAYRKTGSDLIRRLKEFLDQAECHSGGRLQQKQFGELLGVPTSTIHDWLLDPIPGQIRAFLCGLERLPQSDRTVFLSEFCRPCPRLSHPWLAHDPESVRLLRSILAQKSALTVMVGQTPRLRSFVLNALGNSLRQIDSRLQCCGLDLHDPGEFVPAPNMFCLPPSSAPTPAAQVIAEVWPQLRNSKAAFLLLNGVLSEFPKLLPEILRCSRSRHVILADQFPNGFPAGRANIIRIHREARAPELLRVKIEQVGPGFSFVSA